MARRERMRGTAKTDDEKVRREKWKESVVVVVTVWSSTLVRQSSSSFFSLQANVLLSSTLPTRPLFLSLSLVLRCDRKNYTNFTFINSYIIPRPALSLSLSLGTAVHCCVASAFARKMPENKRSSSRTANDKGISKGEERREEDNLFDGIIDSPKRRGRRRKMGEWSETSFFPAAAAAAADSQCPAKRESSVKVSKECALPVRRTRERERESCCSCHRKKSLTDSSE